MNKVGVIMGSKSDYPVMEEAISILKDLNRKDIKTAITIIAKIKLVKRFLTMYVVPLV